MPAKTKTSRSPGKFEPGLNPTPILPNDVTYVIPRNSIFYLNWTWLHLTGVTNLYQLADVILNSTGSPGS